MSIAKAEWLYQVRDFLKDTDQQAFSDAIILTYTKKALKDIARKTHYFRAKAFLPVLEATTNIALPSNHIKTLKLLWNNCTEIELVQSTLMCGCDDCDIGTPKYAIQDLTGRKTLKLVPKPDKSLLTELNVDEYGFLINIEGDLNTDCGREIIDDDVELFGRLNIGEDIYGVVEDITQVATPLTIYYIYYPELDTTTETLDFDDYVEDIMLYYVTGHLLRQDKDTVANSIALQQLQFYDREIKLLKQEVKRHFSRVYYPLKQKNIFNEGI